MVAGSEADMMGNQTSMQALAVCKTLFCLEEIYKCHTVPGLMVCIWFVTEGDKAFMMQHKLSVVGVDAWDNQIKYNRRSYGETLETSRVLR